MASEGNSTTPMQSSESFVLFKKSLTCLKTESGVVSRGVLGRLCFTQAQFYSFNNNN